MFASVLRARRATGLPGFAGRIMRPHGTPVIAMKAPDPPLVVVFNVGAGHGEADEVRCALLAGQTEPERQPAE